MGRKYAVACWSVDDILAITDFTKGEAEAFLEENESSIEGQMVSAGWETVRSLLPTDRTTD